VTVVPFCEEEKEHIREQRKQGISYSWIAQDINERFYHHNQGTRTSRSVEYFVHSEKMVAIRRIKIPKKLLSIASDQGLDTSNEHLSTLLVRALEQQIVAKIAC